LLDAFDKLVAPGELGARLESCSGDYADHMFNLMEGKNKPIQTLTTQTTYAELKMLFEKIMAAPYWAESFKKPELVVQQETETSTQQVEQEQVLSSSVEGMHLNENQQLVDNQQGSKKNYSKKPY